MSGIYSGVGRVISVEYKAAEETGWKQDLLEISVSITTGEKKKEGEKYAPSNIFKVPLWGKYAEAMRNYVEVGKSLYVTGLLTFNAYVDKQGEPKASPTIRDAKVELVGNMGGSDSASEEVPAESVKEAATKAAAKQKKAKEEVSEGIQEISFD